MSTEAETTGRWKRLRDFDVVLVHFDFQSPTTCWWQ